jgi:hypothetical protein
LLTLLVTHVTVSVFAYYLGAVAMRRQISREFFKYLDDWESRQNK